MGWCRGEGGGRGHGLWPTNLQRPNLRQIAFNANQERNEWKKVGEGDTLAECRAACKEGLKLGAVLCTGDLIPNDCECAINQEIHAACTGQRKS